MSIRLRRRWIKTQVAATKESCCYIVLLALIVLCILSDNFQCFPPLWQILVVVSITILLIWGMFYHAKKSQKMKDKRKDFSYQE